MAVRFQQTLPSLKMEAPLAELGDVERCPLKLLRGGYTLQAELVKLR